MRQLFLIEDSPANKISYYLLLSFVVTLPFDYFYSQLILICFAFHTLIYARRSNLKQLFSKPVLILISIYLLGILALFYSADKQEGFNILTRQLAILLFPVLFSLTELDFKKYRLNILCIFGITCTFTILYLYADAVHTIFYFHMPMASLFTLLFMNHNFSLPIEIHATYLSVYTAFSLLLFIYLTFESKGLLKKWVCIIAAFILCAGLIQLSSRSVFIAFLLIINLVFPFFLFYGRKRVIFLVAASVISAATLLAITRVDSFKTRYINELKTDLTKNARIIENTEPRVARWNAILELIKKSPVIGYGTGAEKSLLKEKYFEKGLFFSYLNEFNAHNEYLSFLLKTGIIGLAVFVYVLFYGFSAAVRNGDLLFLSFMMLVAITCISENFLELNKGIFFYGFFFSFFIESFRMRRKYRDGYLAKA